jgi:hypothetical protein
MKKYFISLLVAVSLWSCGSDDEAMNLSSVTPLVKEASPAGLETAAAFVGGVRLSHILTAKAADADAQDALEGFFGDSFAGISGTSATGQIFAYLGDLDFRISELNQRFQEKKPDCLGGGLVSVTKGLSSLGHTVDLKFSCSDNFSGGLAGSGSGMLWGQEGDITYLGLLLVQSNNMDKFGYFAKVNTATRAVDLIFMEYFPSYSRTSLTHLRTDATGSKYELVYAASGGTAGPAQPSGSIPLAAGVRLITSATEVFVQGTAAATNATGGTSGPSYSFGSQCFNASNLSATPASCVGLGSSSFDSDMALISATQVYSNASNLQSQLSLELAGVSAASTN